MSEIRLGRVTKIEKRGGDEEAKESEMKCRSEKHPHPAEAGGAGPAACGAALMGGGGWDGGGGEGVWRKTCCGARLC